MKGSERGIARQQDLQDDYAQDTKREKGQPILNKWGKEYECIQ